MVYYVRGKQSQTQTDKERKKEHGKNRMIDGAKGVEILPQAIGKTRDRQRKEKRTWKKMDYLNS